MQSAWLAACRTELPIARNELGVTGDPEARPLDPSLQAYYFPIFLFPYFPISLSPYQDSEIRIQEYTTYLIIIHLPADRILPAIPAL